MAARPPGTRKLDLKVDAGGSIRGVTNFANFVTFANFGCPMAKALKCAGSSTIPKSRRQFGRRNGL